MKPCRTCFGIPSSSNAFA